jgi:hypothetical protein
MQRIAFLFLACFLTLGLQAQQATATRTLTAFDGISISGGFDKITLVAGSDERVIIDAKGINVDKITTTVKDGILQLGYENNSGSWGYNESKVSMTIYYKNLSSITSSGSSDIITDGTIKSDNFRIRTSGSGDLKASLNVENLEISISGSSDMRLEGRATNQKIRISGSGDVDASRLEGQTGDVSVSGSGDVKTHIKGPLKTAVSGSGDVDNN